MRSEQIKSKAIVTYATNQGSQTWESRAEIGTFHLLRSQSPAKMAYTAHRISQPHQCVARDAQASLGNTCPQRIGI